MSKMTNAEARKIVEGIKCVWYLDYEDIEALQILLDCEGENIELTRLLDDKECWKEARANAKQVINLTLEISKLKAEVVEIRPYSDCYKRICKAIGIEKDILGYIDRLKKEVDNKCECLIKRPYFMDDSGVHCSKCKRLIIPLENKPKQARRE